MKPIRRPLAAMIATVFALAAPLAYSNSVFVTNCNDSGVGSLRNAVSVANTTDTVDMTGLKTTDGGCSASTITLTTGAIHIPQNDLIVAGPGMDKLTVTGQNIPASGPPTVEHDRIFTHMGTGRLILGNFSIAHGYLDIDSAARGGCIYSKGSVQLFASKVSDCSAISTHGGAFGGALYTKGQSSVYYSTISDNRVSASGDYFTVGGAINSYGGLAMRFSTVTRNSALCASGVTYEAFAGGIYSHGNTYIRSSTISNNSSCYAFGGLVAEGSTASTVIIDSTISNNEAKGGRTGGLISTSLSFSMSNSTVAFNKAATTMGASPGMAVFATTMTLDSNIVSNNVLDTGVPNDISISTTEGGAVSGNNNLIFAPNASLPSDTIVGSCPLLGTLRDNGGPTETIALQSHSPAIDTGINKFQTALPYDQRGMPFARTSGAAPDIGAYEINQADIVFTANLEGCP
jgi:hypothetical protein